MALRCEQYQLGKHIDSPVYVDSNVWASYFIASRPNHVIAGSALASLLVQGEILISTIVFSEIWWAVLEHRYNEIRQVQDPGACPQRLRASLLESSKEWLFPMAQPQLRTVSQTVTSFPTVKIVPTDTMPLNFVADTMVRHMLAPADATHLSLANSFAKSFLTADRHFLGLVDPNSSLTIFLL